MWWASLPVVAALALGGCAATPEGQQPPSVKPSEVSATPATPLPESDRGATVAPVPEAEQSSQDAALKAAEAALTAYARPDLSYTDWITGLYPHLSQAGAAAYEDTDPSRIPVTRITGNGKVLPAPTEVALVVEIPTDAGAYNVSLSRPSADAAWQADRIRPAGS